MKKLLFLFIVLLILFIVKGVPRFRQNFGGAGPAFNKPPADIRKLIEPKQKGVNRTDFPLTIPDGFEISVFADNLGSPRDLIPDPENTVIVSLINEGRVVALPDQDRNGAADSTVTVALGLNKPHGLAFNCQGETCRLYIAETNQVGLYDYDRKTHTATNKRKIIDLPAGAGHFTRSLLFDSKKNKLYISVGSSCNVCNESDWRRTKILVSNPDGSDLRGFASGLRNAVFMTQHPKTEEIWATEMGRDFLGDDLPPDEINILKEGGDYGWPVCYGKNVADTDFRGDASCVGKTPSFIDLPAHSAPLGLAFFGDDLLVAYHGSWNRSVPTGYKVVRIKINGNGTGEPEDFITGWLQNDGALGRPADILTTKEGEIFVSDDKAGVVYRLSEIRQ